MHGNGSSSSGGPGPTATHGDRNCHREQYGTRNPDRNNHCDQYRTRDPDFDTDRQWSLHVRNPARTRRNQ